MKSFNESLGKVLIGVSSKPAAFTFVPVMHKLPFESIITDGERSGALTGKLNKNLAVSKEKATRETMSEEGLCKAEIIYIKDSEERGAGTHLQLKHPTAHVDLPQTSPSFSVQAENTPNHLVVGPASMETAVDKHRGISQQRCHKTSLGAEVSSGFFVNRASAPEGRTSPTHSTDLFLTPASSRESILSEDWDKEKSWSAMQSTEGSLVSFSRTVSPCSSVRSGVFSPAVVRVKRHSLAPGSSLLQMPQECLSSCESLSSSLCPESTSSRHRPPVTRLSLLTAILRKGRLPVLSPALQRPYSPCWPISPLTLSVCNACSAASSVASIPLELSSRFPSSASIDSQAQSHYHRCVTAPPSVELKEVYRTGPHTPLRCSELINSNTSGPRWERVTSPLPQTASENRSTSVNNNTLPQVPLPFFCSRISELRSMSPTPVKPGDTYIASKQPLPSSISSSKLESPMREQSKDMMYLRGHTVDKNLAKVISRSPKPINEQETSVLHGCTRQPYSSPSRLDDFSQLLTSLPPCLRETRPPQSPSVTVSSDTISPPPPLQTTMKGRCQSEQTFPLSTSDKIPQVHRDHCLSPSRYTPIVFSGWPSPTNSSSPSPDRFTLTPSPAPPIRDLTPSPSLSFRSTPSPRPWSRISDCNDREGKKRKPHKIKLSYKSFAAIPTNTILLDQQAIDDQVERDDVPGTLDRCVTETHAEMCSPAQLRQQSEELYAAIDEILEDSIATCTTSRASQPSRQSTNNVGLQHVQQQNTSLPRFLGRETKYASLGSLHPSASWERKGMDKKTKPGVIRPMTAIPRLTVDDKEEYLPNPSRQCFVEPSFTDNKKMGNKPIVRKREDLNTSSKGQTFSKQKNPERPNTSSMPDLLITESEDQIAPSLKDGSWQDASTSFSPTEVLTETF